MSVFHVSTKKSRENILLWASEFVFKLDIFSSIFVVSTTADAATTSVTISVSAVLFFSLEIVSVFVVVF